MEYVQNLERHIIGEQKRGYHDDEGNATHVGIYLGQGTVRHSTHTSRQDGVGDSLITESRWTNIGLLKCLDYESYPQAVDKPVDNVDNTIIARLKAMLKELESILKELEDVL